MKSAFKAARMCLLKIKRLMKREREINDDCGVKQTGFVFGVFDFYIYDGNDFLFFSLQRCLRPFLKMLHEIFYSLFGMISTPFFTIMFLVLFLFCFLRYFQFLIMWVKAC